MATNNNLKLAVLIDADNAQASVIQELLAEVSRYGTATIKRAYARAAIKSVARRRSHVTLSGHDVALSRLHRSSQAQAQPRAL
jgi:hypothetical protein